MKSFIQFGRMTAAALLLGLFATGAQAQATRTWVSGVGDDANPCSRTAPCKTFAGAISKTAASGVISVLDPGGFGAVTITKSITIENDGAIGGILSSLVHGVIVNLPNATDRVVLRGLSIDGAGNGLDGIRFIQNGSLVVERCVINGVAQKGIQFAPTGAGQLFVSDTQIHNANNAANGGAINVAPSGAGTAVATIENVQMSRNLFGVQANANSKVFVHSSVAANNDSNGFVASGGGILVLDDSSATGNTNNGILSTGSGSTVTMSRSATFGNGAGIRTLSLAVVQSFQENRDTANTNASSAVSNLALK
jgi:hypothetical protein